MTIDHGPIDEAMRILDEARRPHHADHEPMRGRIVGRTKCGDCGQTAQGLWHIVDAKLVWFECIRCIAETKLHEGDLFSKYASST